MIQHVIIARAAAEDPEGSHAQVRVTIEGYPTDKEVQAAREMAVAGFREGFDREPQRIGVAVLPYVKELDEEDE